MEESAQVYFGVRLQAAPSCGQRNDLANEKGLKAA